MKYLLLLLLLSPFLSAVEPLSRGFVLQRKQDKSCVALVVGNSKYADAPLKNPVNDAEDAAKALENLGFIVTKITDVDRISFQKSVEEFGKSIIGKQAACFYYAGHGIQVAGENFLLPVGETLNNEAEVQYKSVNAGLVLAQMEAAKCPINLVVLDACRNNPLSKAGRSSVKGLAQVQGPAGSVIVYATAAGQIAGDGDGRNGVFTTAFLKHLATPGQDIDLFLRVVSGEVQKASEGKQVPWRSSNLTQGFCFVPAPTAAELELERKQRGELLGTLEVQQAEMDKLRKAEEAKMLAKQAEIAEMEQKIKDAQAKMNAGGGNGAGGDFEAIVAMVDAKEKQAAELAEMQKKADAARKAREKELADLVAAENGKRRILFEADLGKYRKLAASEHGASMKDQAWAALLKKWKVENIPVGDEGAFAKALRLEPPTGAKPTWASAGGKDQFGTWADLQVAGVTQRFRWIVPGTFTMGSPQSEKDLAVQAGAKAEWVAPEVQHEVTMSKGYWLADSECTQGLWQAITGSNPAKFQDSKNPVEQVSWDDCQGFLSKLNSQVAGVSFRLPSEAEWEYACRAGTKTPFSFGATITPDQVNYDGNYPFGGAAKGLYREKTVAVKSFQANAWGLYDMHGNVWEWCGDWYGDYSTGNVTDPIGPASGSFRVNRGGGWNFDARGSWSASRSRNSPGDRDFLLGFRLCAPVQVGR